MFYIPQLKVKDIIDSDYKLIFSEEEEKKYYISTLISPFIYQVIRISGNNTDYPKEIVQVEARHNKKKWAEYRQLMNNGFVYNGIKYLRFGKSASQSKSGITVFVADYIWEELYRISSLDLPMWNKEVCIPKYEAQRGLIFSTCTLLDIPIPRICIIDSYSKIIPNQKIRYVEEVEKISDNGKKYKVREVKDGYKDIKITPWDGCGVHHKRISEAAQRTLELDYTPVGLQIRLPFCKGFSVEFPFREWFAENDITEIKDVFGNWYNINEIDAIWNTDMLKCYPYFKEQYGCDGWNKYIEVLNKYEFKLGVSKYSHHINHINVKSRMNFQYLQCLDLWNNKYVEHYDKLYSGQKHEYNILDENNHGKIINYAKYSTDLFEKICGGSKFHTLKFMGIGNSEEDDISSAYLKAVLINETMLKDPSVKRYIKRKAQKKIDEMKIGKIYCGGFYHTVFGDIIGYLQYCGGLEPIGILNWGEFFTDTIYENNQNVISFRSPLICPSETNKIKIVSNLEEKWFGHFKGQDVAMVNIYDLSAPIQGGMDFDSDSVLLCLDSIVVDNKINKTIVIDIDDKITVKKQIYNQGNITEYELNSRDERIGEITNAATSILNKYTNNNKWKTTYEDYISLLRLLQGKEIDSIKTGIRWNLPKNIRNYLKKVPYFLLYNYPKKLNRYKNLQREPEFDIEGNRIKNAYHSPSPLNELCQYICRWERKKLIWDNSQINTGVLLVNDKLKLKDKTLIAKLRKINRDFCLEWNLKLKERDRDDSVNLNECLEKYKNLVLQQMKDKYLLANYFIKISYDSVNTNKTLCWYIFSDEILKNLIKNSKREKRTEIIFSENGQYEFLGKYYEMLEG